MKTEYEKFIASKNRLADGCGFKPTFIPDFLFDFQKHLVDWSVNLGRAALFEDCGMGKTPQQLCWAQNVVEHTNKPVLILTPLAVSHQTEREAHKFGIDAVRSADGKIDGKAKIIITNYEKLKHFNPSDFDGCACDESSILKNYSGATRQEITDFMLRIKHRSLWSATPAPNDHMELGNSSEALGVMRRVEMLAMFFVHDGGETSKWRLKGHAGNPFWRFMASWARTIRRPSDLGFSDGGFILPELVTQQHLLPSRAQDGFLFASEAVTLDEQRKERRQTIDGRCGKVAEIANEVSGQFIAWCSLNDESERLAELIDGAEEVTGSMDDEEKAEKLIAFTEGKIRVLVTKPEIAGFGMNFQGCADMSFFPSHSYEQYYQSVRRCWRFGQKRNVNVHIVTTESESAVLRNMQDKEAKAAQMFEGVVRHMKDFYTETKTQYQPQQKIKVPSWLNA
jgi:hypothetical protein